MNDLTDEQLLKQYCDSRCSESFRSLVERHIDLVHSVATRVIGNPCDAQDISQKVFARLAESNGQIPKSVPLPAWLHQITRGTAASFVRSEERRRKRHVTAVSQIAMNEDPLWEDLAPLIDDVIGRLPQADQIALLLRFYAGKSHAEIGSELEITEEAARKRIRRSLDKLRGFLSRRGVVTTTSFLATALSGNAVASAPPGIAGSISASALAMASGSNIATTSLLNDASIFISVNARTILIAAVMSAAVFLAFGIPGSCKPRQKSNVELQNLTGDDSTVSGWQLRAHMGRVSNPNPEKSSGAPFKEGAEVFRYARVAKVSLDPPAEGGLECERKIGD